MVFGNEIELPEEPDYDLEMAVFDALPERMRDWMRSARVLILATDALASLRFWGSIDAAIMDMERQIDAVLAEEAGSANEVRGVQSLQRGTANQH